MLIFFVKAFVLCQIIMRQIKRPQYSIFLLFDRDVFSGGNEDDEPDKMAIAFGRFGTFKRFLVSIFDNIVIESISIILHIKVRSVKEFFVFLKNKIIEAVTGRRPYQEEFDEGEKGYQVSFFFNKNKEKLFDQKF